MAYWICEQGGIPSGPHHLDHIRAMARCGSIGGTAMACRAGESNWIPLTELLHRSADSTATTNVVLASPPMRIGSGFLLRCDLGTASVIALSIVSFGIYGLVWFYQVLMSYRAVGGSSRPTQSLFWWYVGILVLIAVAGFLLLPVLAVGAAVIGAILLRQVLADRDAAIARLGIQPHVHGVGTHMSLWILGNVFSWIIVGLIPAIIQAVWFVSDHRRLVEAARHVRPDCVAGSL